MNRKAIQNNLAAAIAARAVEGDRVGEARVEAVTDICRRSWIQLQSLIKRGPKSATPAAVNAILQGMTTATTAAIEPVLIEGANRGFDSAFEIWVDHLPREWWRLAVRDDPEATLLENLDFGYSNQFKGPNKQTKKFNPAANKTTPAGKFPTAKPKPLPPKKKVKPKTAERVKKKTKPKPSETLKIIRKRGWKSRLDKWSNKITDKDKVAERIADGFDKGLKPETIIKRIKPFVQEYTSSARRIVRTELARIENAMMEQTFQSFIGIIDGFQIINPLDERTRPLHGIRAGKIYWNDPKKKPHAGDRPELPDEPNCRCCYAPILNAPAPDELKNGPRPDSRTYAAWFNNQTDKVKARVVGKDRWDAVKNHTAKPSLFDFTDKDSGRFLTPTTLKKPRPGARDKAKARKKTDVTKAKKTLKYWPPV